MRFVQISTQQSCLSVMLLTAKNETGYSRGDGRRKNTPDAHPSYGATPVSEDMVAQDPNGVNKKLSARDTAGRELTQEQQEFFRDSKVRDEQGRLMVMYHGTPNGSHTKFRSGLPDWTDGMDLQEFIEEMEYDYDGLILDEGATGGYGLEVQSRGLSYVTFSPEQVKNVDNKAPTKNPNIRFSERDPAAQKLNRALEKKNAAQAQELQHLLELVKLQGQVTNGTKFTRSSVRTLAQQLMKDAGAKGNYLELAEILNGIYESIASAKEDQELNWGEGDEAAQWLLEHIEVKPDRGEYANDILRDLRGRKISLNDGQRAEVESRYGSYDNFRKSMFGSVIISKDGTPLDMVWQELSGQYPEPSARRFPLASNSFCSDS